MTDKKYYQRVDLLSHRRGVLKMFAAAAAKLLQSYLTLCDPIDGSPLGSSVPAILQARTLKWAAISFSRDLPDPEIELRSPALQAGSLPSESPGKPICGIRSMGKVGHRGRNSSEFSPTCWGPAPADPGYSKERWRR